MSEATTAIAGDEGEALWTPVQTAKYLALSVSWVYRHTETGEIPAAKLGGVWRYKPARVREYAEQMQQRSSAVARGKVVAIGKARKGKR